jgi:superfamily I DNA/RNA helicase
VNAYVRAREAIGSDALVKITANFRSVEPILDLVNAKFAAALSEAAGQPGFTALSSTRKVGHGGLAVAALDVGVDADEPNAAMLRDAEANRVADPCSRLVGNRQIRDSATEAMRPCQFGDIALLAPVGTDLWRFEEALEERGIAVSTQAGKGFFRRQETQDLIALTRALADSRDTLALGAVLRRPLVGLSEAELLDIAEGLPVDPERPGRLPQLSLWTDLDLVTHELACSVLGSLQSLAKRARSTTPQAAVGRREFAQRSSAASAAVHGGSGPCARQRRSVPRNPGPTMFAACVRSHARCGPTGKRRSGRWRAAPTPRSSRWRSSPSMPQRAWNGRS